MKNRPMTHHANILTQLQIEGLTHDGRGVARVGGKAIFITNTVPGDIVTAKVTVQQTKFDEAELLEIETPSSDRAEPFCPKYQTCGGCQLQHLSIQAQRFWKSENFLTRLTQAVNSDKCQILEPITGNDRGYRRRARLGLAIGKKDKVAKLGFRQKESNELVDIEHCPVLSDGLNEAIAKHRPALLEKASRAYKELTVVEADNGVFGFEDETKSDEPYYTLNNLKLTFPQDGFIQVNAELNREMVNQAIEWLELESDHKVLDLFCGVGNFTLPIAQKAKQVVGIEGLAELVETAANNAAQNDLENATFHKANLFEDCTQSAWFKKQKYHRLLLDPGRQGAFEISKVLHELKAEVIVYVSCNAATLIRDVKELEKQGYRLTKANLIDMFPHTTHTEVMVQLKKFKQPKNTAKKRAPFKF
ncbi:23S rRNA (uracil(1939)-C(5))-methyltransferase RlmD [Thiomicrorhabdus sp. ZW0627]|uniref:23S rRNA (uracil(1939)-C(5))-methyltransferase RlmD n=1 Tax=Thiomicrorhabdus sp. ZW0627 TaxID=3039774 RepID=UPI002436CF23|nr:23S rRNA (uracil(1939)-C(5))-methyltransferase RlmD [Thiomicrorhabdus sp. ZW0627]MDG6774707.1 23S rRNA (uracil(1939)-C(5))-methyltransferase RlmD [Thiomicrorhabdus sp. ZW0627]